MCSRAEQSILSCRMGGGRGGGGVVVRMIFELVHHSYTVLGLCFL